jgi:U3 small nucleolar ribonucleoprotein protein IMP4
LNRNTVKILITTSRRPSPRTRSLVKDLASILPNADRFTRGHYSMRDLAREALLRGANRIVVIAGRMGNPSLMRIYAVEEDSLRNIASLIIKGVALSRELRRPLPLHKPKSMIIEVDGSPLADLVSDYFIKAFGARLLEKPTPSDIIAKLQSSSQEIVTVEFLMGGKLVGPRLRVYPTRRTLQVD